MEEGIKKIAETPAIAIDKTIVGTKVISGKVIEGTHIKKASDFWHNLGPGLTTGAADDDPSGIATYSQTGAQFGFQLLWLSIFTFPLMAVVQEMCARIGLATGRGLAGNIRLYYPKWVLYVCTMLLFAANTLNLGADIGAMAKATSLLFGGLDFYLMVVVFTLVSLGLQIFTTYERYAKYLKWLALILFAYVISALTVHLNYGVLLRHAVVPSITFSQTQIFLICGILGTTISPYLFFWQTSMEIEEEIAQGKTTIRLRQSTTDPEIKNMRIDVWSGMFVSNLVMFAIIAACGATLFSHGITNIQTADQAALALKPIAGNNAFLLYALGIIGTGMLAVPVLAGSASYAFSESLKWKHGLSKTLKDVPAFYGVIIISMLIGMGMNFMGIDPIKALIYSAVANGLVAPVVLVLIVKISSSKKIMGSRANGSITRMVGWLVTIAMIISGVAAISSFVV